MSYLSEYFLNFYRLLTMNPFALGVRVVTINTDISAPIYSMILKPACVLADGSPRENTVYHVEGIKYTSGRNQGFFITGLRVLVGREQFTLSNCRFRKVDLARDSLMQKKSGSTRW